MARSGSYAQQLARAMREPAVDARFAGVDSDLTRITDEELGDLLAVACPLLTDQTWNGPPTRIAHAVAAAARERSRLLRPPRRS